MAMAGWRRDGKWYDWLKKTKVKEVEGDLTEEDPKRKWMFSHL